MSYTRTRRTRKATILAKLNKNLARKRKTSEAADALTDAQASTAAGDSSHIMTTAFDKAADSGPSAEVTLATLCGRSQFLSARMKDIALGKRGRWDVLRRWKNLWCKRSVLNQQIRVLKQKQWHNASSDTATGTTVEEPAVPEKAQEASSDKQTAASIEEIASKSVSHSKTFAVRTLKVVRNSGPAASGRRFLTLEKLEQIVRGATLKKIVGNRICVECPVCGDRKFPGHVREHLANHLRAEDRPFRCPLGKCSMTATKLDIIEHHVTARHPHFLGRWTRILAPMSEVETTKIRLDACIRRLLKQRTIEGSCGFAQPSLTSRRLLTDCPQPVRQVVVQRPAPGKRHPPVAHQDVVYRADGRPFVLKPPIGQHLSTVTRFVHATDIKQRLLQSLTSELDASQKRNAPATKQRVVYRIGPQGGVMQPGTAQEAGPPKRRTIRDTYLQWQNAVHDSEDPNQANASQKTKSHEQQRAHARQVAHEHQQNAHVRGELGDRPVVSEGSPRYTGATQQYTVYPSEAADCRPVAISIPQQPFDTGRESRAAQPTEQHSTVQWHMPPDSFAQWQLNQEPQLEHNYHQTTYEHASYHPRHSQQVQVAYEWDGQQHKGVVEKYRETVLATHEY
ncbi:hypothetical protein AAVH_09314 [Aphelenchoides avenae]|nr:hypothetical protein AAVH_09314 [Aphelenchus avenae]